MDTIRKMFGLKPAEQKKLEATLAKVRQQRQSLGEEQLRLLDELKKLKQRVKLLNEDYEKAAGPERKILASRIEHTLAERDGVATKAEILDENIRRVALVIQRIEEKLTADKTGVTDVEIDEVTLIHEEAVETMAATGRAAEDLAKSKFELRGSGVDVEKELGELTRPRSKKHDLSKETQKKLKKLLAE